MTLRGKSDPGWLALVKEWKATQERLRQRIVITPLEPLPRFVAGADCAFSTDKQTIFAAAVVYDHETQRIVEVAHATQPAEFPYVPGFVSFREGPAIRLVLACCTRYRIPEPICQADIEVAKLKRVNDTPAASSRRSRIA